MHSEDELSADHGSHAKTEEGHSKVLKVSGMYQDYFLDYASYVILERAVPALNDGLKPVQRRLLHALDELHDGRYHKVANLIGHTMKYHPHGDASIGDALVQLGQKDLLIDCQGNWGNILTGDSAAAPRYIEARLTPFALEVLYHPKLTQWQSSYDGRGKEPLHFPARFPLLLAQGVEGIAVGLSTKILPHNFNELIEASVAILKGESFVLFPDFPTGGLADISHYQDGVRGGKVRVRAKINDVGNRMLTITEIPFGTHTGSLIDSILKANEKGKIKVKKIEDNTADQVEILIHLPPGVSPDQTIDALYAFTDCEMSISPMACVIHNDRPEFLGVSEILKRNTDHTLDLIRRELEIKLGELQEQWHFASLERIFIENRIYRDIEEAENWEQVIQFIRKGLEPHIGKLMRLVTDDDIVRLTEIRIKRITKFDSDKANDLILEIEKKIQEVQHQLSNLIEYAINWFLGLKKRYGHKYPRKTELRLFDAIEATQVALANVKFYVNREEGFVGSSLKKDEFLFDCSDLDDVVVFREDGRMMVTKVDQKTFVGKGIRYVGVFKKNDERTVYNLIYLDGGSGKCFMKRFTVQGITRDKEYDLTQGNPKSKLMYFSANPNGEAEVVSVHLRALQNLKKLKFDIDFSQLGIKSRNSKGNLVSKYPVKRVELKQEGISTLAPRKIWHDQSVNRLNADGRGRLLGAFSGDDRIVEITKNGKYRLLAVDLMAHLEDHGVYLEKWRPERVLCAIYFDGERQKVYVKRFLAEEIQKPEYIGSEHPQTEILHLLDANHPKIELIFEEESGKSRDNLLIDLETFIAVKGLKALGKQISPNNLKTINVLPPDEEEDIEEVVDLKEAVNETIDTISPPPGTRIEESGQFSLEL